MMNVVILLILLKWLRLDFRIFSASNREQDKESLNWVSEARLDTSNSIPRYLKDASLAAIGIEVLSLKTKEVGIYSMFLSTIRDLEGLMDNAGN